MTSKFLSPKSALWALDFGEHTVIAVAARQKPSGEWEVLGEGRTRALGRTNGEIVRLSDVTECVTEALRLAEERAGIRCRSLYFNFDDAGMDSAHPVGSKTLSGEGQISREDVREAARSASRLVGDFERTPVYTREASYLIDGKDSVSDPLGVFGHNLDVTLHVVHARAFVVEQWKNVMRRAQVERFSPVLSLDSVCQAAVENAALARIVWDLGDDFLSGGVVERGVLREYRVFAGSAHGVAENIASVSAEWAGRHGIEKSLLLTGENAEKHSLLGKFSQEGFKTAPGYPKRVPPFSETKDASIAGLVIAAAQREKRTAYVKAGGLWAGRVRDKASAFIQEYF